MKRLDSKGFGLIEGLLILVIIGMLGGVGYYVYSQSKDKSSQQGQELAAPLKTEQNDLHPDWVGYNFESGGFSIKHPKDWKIKADSSDRTGTLVHLISPKFMTTNEHGNKVTGQLRINLFAGPVFEGEGAGEGRPWVGEGGEVKKVTELKNDLKLIWTGYPKQAVRLAVNDVRDVKVGDKRYQEGFTKNGKNLDIKISFDDLTTSEGNGSGPGLLPGVWKNIREYKTAVEILNTLNFN